MAKYGFNKNEAQIVKTTIIDKDGFTYETSKKYSDKPIQNGVKFIDYDGTVLYEYTRDEILAMRKMPPDPKHEGFISQGWNRSLEDTKAYLTKYPDALMTVGEMYITDDGKTRMVMHVGPRLTIPLLIQQTISNGVVIDWGDGHSETIEGTGAVTTSHTYSNEGDYTVTFNPVDDCVLNFGGTIEETRYNVFNENANHKYTLNVKELYIGKNVTSIESNAFNSCFALTSLTIPYSVTSIGQNAFIGCNALTSLIIPEGITTIEQYAFSSCYNLISLTIPEGVTSIEQYAFSNCYDLKSLTIPEGVTTIEQYAISGCFALASLIIPEGVTTIGQYAFYGCYSLASLTIPEGVTSIGQSAFNGCHALASLIIPEGAASIGQSAFQGCYTLASLIIPEGVTTIEQYVFSSCYNLTSLTIPEGVTTIGQNAFQGCYALTSLTIPEDVTTIGQNAFAGCNNLVSLTILEHVESIAARAFRYCKSLYTLTLLPTTPPTLGNVDAFQNIPSDCTIYVPYGTGDTYKAASGWSTWASQIQELPEAE